MLFETAARVRSSELRRFSTAISSFMESIPFDCSEDELALAARLSFTSAVTLT